VLTRCHFHRRNVFTLSISVFPTSTPLLLAYISYEALHDPAQARKVKLHEFLGGSKLTVLLGIQVSAAAESHQPAPVPRACFC
jgi:hypothetical protein